MEATPDGKVLQVFSKPELIGKMPDNVNDVSAYAHVCSIN